MGFFDKLIYANPEEEKQKREEKKSANKQEQEQPLVTGPSYNTNYTVTQTPVGGMMGSGINLGPQVPQDELDKCRVYFGKLMEAAKQQNGLYSTFLETFDTLRQSDPTQTAPNLAKMVFNVMKMGNKSLTKQVLLNDMQSALNGVVMDKDTSFKEKQDKRYLDGVESNSKMIETKQQQLLQKQQEMQKLNEEINLLQQEVEATKQLINVKNQCYDIVSAQVIANIKDEIAVVSNYLQ